jgi:Zn-dependent metalloprotease
MVNIEEHGEFLTFLDNLDSLCVNIAADYSLEWFKQKKETKQLVSRYSNTYTIDEDDHGQLVTCDIEVDNLELLSDLNLYNDDDNLNILVCLDGIEFFKKTFKWKLFIDSVVDELEGEDKEEDDAFDFTDILENREKVKPIEKQQTKSRVNNTKKQEQQVNIETQSKLDGIDKTSIAVSEVINKEVIAELADVANIEKAKNIDIKSTLTNRDKTGMVSDKLSINELESIITQKKNESKEYLLNAERAKRASEGLYQKGMQAVNEIKKYEERLQELSQTTSILSQRK